MRELHIKSIRRWSLLALAGFTTQSLAAGFALQEQSVSSLGNAFAGAAAVAQDPSTIYFNPAGLARLSHKAISVGGHLIAPSANFKDTGSTRSTGGAIEGDGDLDIGETALVPNLYFANPVNANTFVGFAINVPFGLGTEYDSDWVGRYHAVKSDLQVINFSPALAVKWRDNISFGATANIYAGSVRLTNKIDFIALALGPAGTTRYDVNSDLNGDGWGYGFSVGALFDVTSATRIGLAYHSEVHLELKGEADFTVPSDMPAFLLPAANAAFVDQTIQADTRLPASANLSIVHQLNEQWDLLGDVSWTGWHSFNELRVHFDDNDSDFVQPENWTRSLRYAIGADWHVNSQWTLRLGTAYEETPVPSDELRTPRIPDNERMWYAMGGSYRYSDAITFDAGYARINARDTKVNNEEVTTEHVLRGTYDSHVDILSAQATWRF